MGRKRTLSCENLLQLLGAPSFALGSGAPRTGSVASLFAATKSMKSEAELKQLKQLKSNKFRKLKVEAVWPNMSMCCFVF